MCAVAPTFRPVALPEPSNDVVPVNEKVSTAIVPTTPGADMFIVDSTTDFVMLLYFEPCAVNIAAPELPVATTTLNAEPVIVLSGKDKSWTLVIVIGFNNLKLKL